MEEYSKILENAEILKRNQNSNKLIEYLSPVFDKKKTIDVACYLIYAHRRNKEFNTCYRICDEMDSLLGNPARIKSQRKWCNVFENIIYQRDLKKASQYANKILENLNQENSYDFFLVKFICLHLCERYLEEKSYSNSKGWLLKIKSEKLDNKVIYYKKEDESSYEEPITKRRSEKYKFYFQLARIIVESKYIEESISAFMKDYTSNAKTNFLNIIKSKIYYQDGNVNYRIFSCLLMTLIEDKNSMKKSVERNYEKSKLTISDISSYVFCPVSAAIQKSIANIEKLTEIEIDEDMSYHRKYLNDFYESYNNQKGKSIKDIFEHHFSYGFNFNESDLQIISMILESKRIGQNTNSTNYQNYWFNNNEISGSPDMYLEYREKYLVEEVFTSNPVAGINNPFENDQMKMIGYLFEMNLHIGYIFYWNTKYELIDGTFRKKSLITGLKIFKIEKNDLLVEKYKSYKDKAKTLVSGQHIIFSPQYINYNKCISCSYINFCEHKKGNYSQLGIPYKAFHIINQS